MDETNSNNRPVHEARFGAVKAVVWANETRNGTMHNVTVARIYRDGDDWKESRSFSREDLLLLAKALNNCHSWIYAQQGNDSD